MSSAVPPALAAEAALSAQAHDLPALYRERPDCPLPELRAVSLRGDLRGFPSPGLHPPRLAWRFPSRAVPITVNVKGYYNSFCGKSKREFEG